MINISFSVVYEYDRTGRLRRNGTAAVTIRAYHSGKYRYFNTGVYVAPKEWKQQTQAVIGRPDQYELNAKIRAKLDELEGFAASVFRKDRKVCTLAKLSNYQNEKPDLDFIEFYQSQLDREATKRAPSSMESYRQTLTKLKAFQAQLNFEDLKPRVLQNFIDFLFGQGLSPNGVHKHYKNVRKFINLAILQEYLSENQNPCKRVTLQPVKTDKVYLTEHELSLFEGFTIPESKPHWRAVVDFFLFTCYTGLRFSDVARITEENLLITPQGIELFLKAQKTGKAYRQNLRKLFPIPGEEESRPEQILKRRQLELLDPDWPLFVYVNRYSYVKQLKEIARRLPLRERLKSEISSHTGRHTFGTIMAGKIDVHILKELLQHANIRETMIYVHLNQSAVSEALDKIKW